MKAAWSLIGRASTECVTLRLVTRSQTTSQLLYSTMSKCCIKSGAMPPETYKAGKEAAISVNVNRFYNIFYHLFILFPFFISAKQLAVYAYRCILFILGYICVTVKTKQKWPRGRFIQYSWQLLRYLFQTVWWWPKHLEIARVNSLVSRDDVAFGCRKKKKNQGERVTCSGRKSTQLLSKSTNTYRLATTNTYGQTYLWK